MEDGIKNWGAPSIVMLIILVLGIITFGWSVELSVGLGILGAGVTWFLMNRSK